MTNRQRNDDGDNDGGAMDDRDRRIAELEATVRARDEFLAAAAHELRNPITPIVMRLDTLLTAARAADRVPDDIVSGLETVKDYVARYVRRVNALLEVSRLTSGKLQLHHEPVDLTALLRNLVQDAAPIARFHGSRLDLVAQEGVVGTWDRLAIEQVVENLISNALKYGERRPVEVVLIADDRTARIIVRDQGVGISAEDRTRIFERFERAVTGRQQSGFGIGLWVVGRLVAASGGTITVASKPGEGSVFTVTLPLHPKQEDSSRP